MEILLSQTDFDNATNHEMIPLRCQFCHETFYRKKLVFTSTTKNKYLYCSAKCKCLGLQNRVKLNCTFCGKEFERFPNQVNRYLNHFCSQSCSAKYSNANKIGGYRRSKAEILLANLIKSDFPDLVIKENDRSLLEEGLEIDILIESLNLAIELNGPIHYFPIYGDSLLEKTQNKDIQKQITLQKLGYNIIIIDISAKITWKKSSEFLTEYYNNYIRPILV